MSFTSQTSNLKPQTSNLKPQTSNLKPQTSNLKPQTLDIEKCMNKDYSTLKLLKVICSILTNI